MSLALTLSALRELIMDVREYPQSEAERFAWLSSRHPALSIEERQDLARIPPERLRLYTESIFASERSLLRRKFPLSFALLKQLSTAEGVPLDFYELARDLHSFRPWGSSSVPELARNFADFIRSKYSRYIEQEPLLGDALTLELACMVVARSPNGAFAAHQSANLSGVSELKLDTVLLAQCYIPEFVKLEQFGSDVISLFEDHRREETIALPPTYRHKMVFGVCSRDRSYRLHWCNVAPAMFGALSKMPRGEFFILAELAQEFLGRTPNPHDEIAVAAQFLRGVLELHSKGALLVRSVN